MPIARKQSQKEKVLKYLEEGNSITPLKAQSLFNAWRLADIVYKLKKDGHIIFTRVCRDVNNKAYARYYM